MIAFKETTIVRSEVFDVHHLCQLYCLYIHICEIYCLCIYNSINSGDIFSVAVRPPLSQGPCFKTAIVSCLYREVLLVCI